MSERALVPIMLTAALTVSADDTGLPDAALLEFLADWEMTDDLWLDTELDNTAADSHLNEQTMPRAEMSHD